MPKLSFSNLLRQEREAKGLSLKAIADQTKISTRFLKAIEEEKLQILPGGVFTTSFVQQYAQFLGVDEDVSITEFIRSTTEARTADIIKEEPLATKEYTLKAASWVAQYRFVFAGILAVLVLAFVSLFLWKYSRGNQESENVSIPQSEMLSSLDATASDAQVKTESSQQGLIPSAMASVTDLGIGQSEANADMELKIASVGLVWLSILADGNEWKGMLAPNQTKQIKASESIRITVGDAGAVALSFNGKYFPTIGQPGEVKHLVFTPEGPDPLL
ncbi:MAG: hypothetical protein A3F68_11740 [Acidobacteria bacterium RIFCSPLOWO2_12_FULL_54_10]|nr:MAG: hypothetical protein A3F68_11740 [Acidobacteria bacterium RIFCSPLOWO2_12_FULL_54_10]